MTGKKMGISYIDIYLSGINEGYSLIASKASSIDKKEVIIVTFYDDDEDEIMKIKYEDLKKVISMIKPLEIDD
ncbi:MAG: hypothetical protein GF364_14325 [Candidatus Lokiarchaeota archaeon]|nr:hypothetical protein [Candidatus Lokiarchaeota archaeon]